MSLPTPKFSIDLSGQTALVTGASGGLGRRFAQVLAASGARVAVAARRLDRLTQLVEEIEEAGGKAVAIQLDVTDAEQLISAVGQAEDALGPVTILVNDAGIIGAALATDIPVEQFDTVVATNLRAPYILSCEVARRLIRAKLPGRIVNISSTAAFHCADGGIGAYSMTKAGLIRMTETLAVEWAAFNINVNAIAPGAFDTEMMAAVLENNPGAVDHFPRRRMGNTAQLDGTLLYLVSPSSDFVTGTCIRVDDAQQPR